MEENTRIRGIYTVVKMIVNDTEDNTKNRIITKTLGKFGVINMDYRGPCPQHDELWYVKIDKEIKFNTPSGCIVLTPIMRLNREDVHVMIPRTGLSTEHEENGVCYVVPTNPNKFFMIPLEYRKSMRNVRFTVCVHRPLGDMSVDPLGLHTPERIVASNNPYAPQPDDALGWTEEAVMNYATTNKR